MNRSKFTFTGFSFDPIVNTGATPSMPPNAVMTAAARHLRQQGAAGQTPTLASHAGVLQRDPALTGAAQELAGAHMLALAGGTQAPTATEIFKQTPEFANSLGMHDTPTVPKQNLGLGVSKKRSMSMGK